MFPRRMIRRGIRRRGIRRGFLRLSRAAIISMAGAATGITLAEIAARENISEEEAEELMDDLVSEKVLKKEQRNGKTVYFLATAAEVPAQAQPAAVPQGGPAPAVASIKFCRECGAHLEA